MHALRLLLIPALMLVLAAQVVAAVDADSGEPPVLQISISDGQRLLKHWNSGLFGQVWSGPACDVFRTKLKVSLPNLQDQLGFIPSQVLATLVKGRFQLFAGVHDLWC